MNGIDETLIGMIILIVVYAAVFLPKIFVASLIFIVFSYIIGSVLNKVLIK